MLVRVITILFLYAGATSIALADFQLLLIASPDPAQDYASNATPGLVFEVAASNLGGVVVANVLLASWCLPGCW